LARKQKKPEIKHTPTKRQLSKWQQQKRIQRIIMITGSVFFAIILAFVGYGYYDAQIKPLQQKVLKVNDTVINMDYYIKWLALSLPGVQPFQRSSMADIVLSYIMRNELIIQRASALGVTVSDSELDAGLAEQNLPSDKVVRDEYKASVLSERLISTYFDSKVPSIALQIKADAMFLESKALADDLVGRISGGEVFSELAKEFSKEAYTKEKSGELGWLQEDSAYVADGKFNDSLLSKIAFSTAAGSISTPTYDSTVGKSGGYWLLKVTEIDAEKSRQVSGILLGTMEEAVEIKNEIDDGANFITLAKDKSQHVGSKDFGGDLGWIQQGQGNEVIATAAFALPLGIVSEPIYDNSVTTKGGYWVIKVLEREENRKIEEATRGQMINKLFQDWLEEQHETSVIEQYLNAEQKAWAVDYTLKKLGIN
jgi:parvulin-like peptidyl-prolyl isomerase